MGDVKADEFDWAGLVANFIHPVKVDVIEALHYIDAPLSSTDLRKVFDNSLPLSNLSHHVTDLAKKGALVKVRDRKVRGSVESFYELR